jgi:Zn-dependent protease with chaperone function
MRYLVIPMLLVMAACMPAGSVDAPIVGAVPSARAGVSHFDEAVARVLPVAHAICERQRPDARCDFKVVIDTRYKVTPNAYQTVDADGRPVLGVTEGLLAMIANRDELAFVLAHEAAHHVAGHTGEPALTLLQHKDSAMATSHDTRRTELEADALGVAIARAAGFDPLRGARFFLRLPDPGKAVLGTHPDHETRWRNVTQAARAVRG